MLRFTVGHDYQIYCHLFNLILCGDSQWHYKLWKAFYYVWNEKQWKTDAIQYFYCGHDKPVNPIWISVDWPIVLFKWQGTKCFIKYAVTIMPKQACYTATVLCAASEIKQKITILFLTRFTSLKPLKDESLSPVLAPYGTVPRFFWTLKIVNVALWNSLTNLNHFCVPIHFACCVLV